jgi:hypothetical protein
MKALVVTAAILSCICLLMSPALARPPTVMNSPGYQARLTESQQALQASQYYYWQRYNQPVTRKARRVAPQYVAPR